MRAEECGLEVATYYEGEWANEEAFSSARGQELSALLNGDFVPLLFIAAFEINGQAQRLTRILVEEAGAAVKILEGRWVQEKCSHDPRLPGVIWTSAPPVLLRGRILAVFLPKLSLQVRPELLQDIRSHVDTNLHAKLRDSIADSPIISVVRIGDGNRG